MANMTYCRFQNTLNDLKDCFAAIKEEDFEDMSQDEKRAKDQLIALCGEIWYYVDEYDENEE